MSIALQLYRFPSNRFSSREVVGLLMVSYDLAATVLTRQHSLALFDYRNNGNTFRDFRFTIGGRKNLNFWESQPVHVENPPFGNFFYFIRFPPKVPLILRDFLGATVFQQTERQRASLG